MVNVEAYHAKHLSDDKHNNTDFIHRLTNLLAFIPIIPSTYKKETRIQWLRNMEDVTYRSDLNTWQKWYFEVQTITQSPSWLFFFLFSRYRSRYHRIDCSYRVTVRRVFPWLGESSRVYTLTTIAVVDCCDPGLGKFHVLRRGAVATTTWVPDTTHLPLYQQGNAFFFWDSSRFDDVSAIPCPKTCDFFLERKKIAGNPDDEQCHGLI